MQHLKILWPFLTSFAVFIACIYNTAYWSSFRINAFEFLTINQIVLASVKVFIWMPLALVFGSVLGVEVAREADDLRSEGNTFRANLQDWIMNGLMVASGIIGTLALIVGYAWWPLLLGPAIAAVSARWIAGSSLISEQSVPAAAVFGVTFMTIALVFSAYGLGRIEAQNILMGRSFLAVSEDACSDRYVGKVGDVLVFYQPRRESIRIRPLNGTRELSLHPNKHEKCDVL